MGLFSFLRKNKQESTVGKSDFYSQADVEPPAGRNKRKQSNKREEAVDPVLPEKKRARRRLVGAIALVLAAIIGLPMILDSEPKPLADDIDIQIPSRDEATPLAQSRARAADTTNQSLTDSLHTEEEIIEPLVKKAETAIEVKPVEADKKTLPPVVKADVPEPKTTIAPPAIAKTDQSDEAARARAILEGRTAAVAPTPAKASGKLVLQVAALASQEKVDELQKKLKDAGLQSHTQKVATESGERIRVRLGPFATADEAEKTRAKLVKIGLNAKLMPA